MVDNKFKIAFKVKVKNGVLQKFIDEKGWSLLTPREKLVIKKRFGFSGYYGGSDLESVGDKLGGISRERIRQIEVKALRKLRKHFGAEKTLIANI